MSGFRQVARANAFTMLNKGMTQAKDEEYKQKTEQFEKEYLMSQRTEWEDKSYQYSNEVVKLGLVILMHVYYEDDGEISYMEKASLVNVLKNEGIHISDEEKHELLSYQSKHVHRETVLDYINRYQISDTQVKDSVNLVRNICNKPIYIDLLAQLENFYKNNK